MNQKGMSLVELLIGMVMFLIILAAVSVVLRSGFMAQQQNMAQGHNLENGRIILNNIADSVRYATAITSPTSGNTSNQLAYAIATYDSITKSYISPPQTYLIKRGTFNENNNCVAIYVNGSTTANSGMGMGLIHNDNDISFNYAVENNQKLLTINLSLNDHSYSGSPTFNLSTTIQLLNIQ